MLGLKYKIVGSKLEVLEQNSITQNSKNQFECQFEFSDEWDKLTKFCVFEIKGQNPICVEIEDNKCMVSTTAAKYSTFKTGVFGISEEATYTTNLCVVFINTSVSIDDGFDDDTTKNLYEQFILDAIAIRDEAKGYANVAKECVEQYPKVIDGLLYFWDSETQEFVQTEFQDGFSAYELAVEQGFEGDLEEWIESLKGEKGDTGEQGVQGEKGDTGVQGIQGEKGEQGLQGIQGEKGDTGDTYELTDQDKQEIASIAQEEVTNARTSFEGDIQDSLDERINVDIAMLLDRFNSATSIPYEGESITAENSYLGMTSGLEIQGQTYQNLVRFDLTTSQLFYSTFHGSLDDGAITLTASSSWQNAFYKYNIDRFKENTVYTIILNILSNTLDGTFTFLGGNDSGLYFFKSIYSVSSGTTGTFKFLKTTRSDLSDFVEVARSYISSACTEGSITYSFIILEGDYTNIDLPNKIDAIESVFGDLIMTSSDLNDSMDQITYENIELRRIGDTYDSIADNKLTQRIGTQNYLDGDLEIDNVLVNNDLTTTYYILDTPIITDIDTKELKTYDGTTYITSSGSNVQPIISARIPSDVGAVIAEVSATNETLTEELEAANQTIDTLVTVE